MKRKIFKTVLTSLVLCVFTSLSALAEIKLSALVSDNMVLQQGQKVPVWGWADAGENITVKFAGQEASSRTDKNGKWIVWLKSMPVCADGKAMLISSSDANDQPITINNVVVGEVWLCSGQSNMAMAVKGCDNLEEEKKDADYPNVRHFTVTRQASITPLETCTGAWIISAADTIEGFSATAYFFGRALHKGIKVPVGLINSSWGGTRVEAWTAPEYLKSDAAKEYIAGYEKSKKEYDPVKAKENFDKALAKWEEAKKKAKDEGKPAPRKPQMQTDPAVNQNHPSNLYRGQICPLLPYAIKGAIWYQGESNARDVPGAIAYYDLLSAMIKNWRDDWGYRFPFYAVQLPNFKAEQVEPVEESSWPYIRESFTRIAEDVKDAGMAVTIDVGMADNIHPKDKQTVGRRLAMQALKNVYKQDVIASGPLYKSMKKDDGKIVIKFDCIGSGLKSKDGGALKTFAIAGKDKKFVAAEAEIAGDTVVVSSSAVTEPVAVRYAWAANPHLCNLFNKEGLPASPFRTDKWEAVEPVK